MWQRIEDYVEILAASEQEAARLHRNEKFQACIVPNLKKGLILPIDRRQKIYLSPLSGNGPRFVALFRATWRRLPQSVRRKILKHWHNHRLMCQVPFSPQIMLADLDAKNGGNYVPGVHPSKKSVLFGNTSIDGHRVRFNANVVDVLPDNLVCNLVAHELAHVFQGATGIREAIDSETREQFHVDAYGNRISKGMMEDDANYRMREWGFDAGSIGIWLIETCRKMVCNSDFDGVPKVG